MVDGTVTCGAYRPGFNGSRPLYHVFSSLARSTRTLSNSAKPFFFANVVVVVVRDFNRFDRDDVRTDEDVVIARTARRTDARDIASLARCVNAIARMGRGATNEGFDEF
jgi:hypothetical protein